MSASIYVCPNRSCGVSHDGHALRTEIGRRYGMLLVVRAIVDVQVTTQRTELRCPVCGWRILWSGSVAVIVEALAA